MVQSWDENTDSYNDEFEETAFADFNLIHEFNRPCMASIELLDPDGSLMQKYDVDTAHEHGEDAAHEVHIGPCKVTIEYPDAADKYYGRVVKARHNREKCRTYLLCYDWMHQLTDEVITYDMREDLDGAGLRQSELHSDIDGDETTSISPTYTSGADYYMYDDDMDWALDEWNEKYVVLPLSIMKNTVLIGPYKTTFSVAPDTNDPSDGHKYLWDDDANYHEVADDNVLAFNTYYNIRVFATEGSLNGVITSARIHLRASVEDADESSQFGIMKVSDGNPLFVGKIETATYAAIQSFETSIPTDYLDDIVDANGNCRIAIRTYSAGVTSTLKTYYCMLELTIASDGYSSLITIEDTEKTVCDMAKAFRYEDGVGYHDETTDMASAGVGDVQLLPNPLSTGDGFYFGSSSKFSIMTLTISQAGAWAGNSVWQYWDGDSWESLTLNDGASSKWQFEALTGELEYSWTEPADWETTAVNESTLYWIRTIVTTTGITTTPLATIGWLNLGNTLKVDTDCSIAGLGLWEGCKYAICQEIYKHIDTAEGGTLVSSGGGAAPDIRVELTAAAGVEHTSGISTRKYENMTRMAMLQDLANADQAVFWMTLATATFNWKQTFDGAGTAFTDDSVLFWTDGEWDYETMYNKFLIYGIRIGDTQVYATDSDATSIDTYGGVTRSKAITNQGLMCNADATALAGALVDRHKNTQLYLGAVLKGFSTFRLGDELSITSTQLGLTAAKYVITNWSFDYANWNTKIRLHPQSTVGYVTHGMYGEDIRQILEESKEMAVTQYAPNTTTQVL